MTDDTGTGTSRAADGTASARMLDRVRKLLSKAERAGSEAEAEAFTAKATELMLKYSIDEALLQKAGEKRDEKIVAHRVEVKGYAKAKLTLMHRVATGLGCRSVEYTNDRRGWSTGSGQVVGWESDIESFKVLFASLQMQAAHEATRELKRLKEEWPALRAARDNWQAARNDMEHRQIWQVDAKADTSRGWCPVCGEKQNAWMHAYEAELSCVKCGHVWTPLPRLSWGEKNRIREEWREANPEPEDPGDEPPHGRSFMQSFLIGYAGVVGSRLFRQRQSTVAAVDEDRPGTALAVIDRDKAVQADFDRRHPDLRAGSARRTSSNAGYYSGRAAGARANLGQSSVGGGHRAIGR